MDNKPKSPRAGSNEPWLLRLYTAGWTPASAAAIANLKNLEAEYLPVGSTVEIIDLLKHPEAGRRDHVVAIPTTIRVHPSPVRRIIGTLDDLEKTLSVLELNRP